VKKKKKIKKLSMLVDFMILQKNINRVFFIGLDSDYVEYLKSKKQKALEAELAMTEEQKQSMFPVLPGIIFIRINLFSALCS